jgi:mevalonate kinase
MSFLENQNNKRFYSNGKLLLTAEYFVLDGATAFAAPTKYGQDLVVQPTVENRLQWESYDHKNCCWLAVDIEILAIESGLNQQQKKEAKMLLQLLKAVKNQNPSFFSTGGFKVKTYLSFPRNWGLGSSSTLLNNLAQWAGIDAYQLLNETFGGSGYDLACAMNNTHILYSNKPKKPLIECIDFQPVFLDQLYFVHLNKKQDSRKGIQRYFELRKKENTQKLIETVDQLSEAIVSCNDLKDFEKLIAEHEQLVSKTIQLPKIQDSAFSDYFGQTKSLGAWGGDFILATGNDDTPNYFYKKGFQTVIPYNEMILS